MAVRQPLIAELDNSLTQTVTLPFTVDSSRVGHQFEFRVFWFDTFSTTESVLGYVPLQWNGANAQSNPWHLVGRPIGTEWSAQVGDGQQWFQYGPYTTLPAGTYIAMWTLRIDVPNAFNNEVAFIDVNDGTTQTRLQFKAVMRHDFKAANTQQVFQIPFVVDSTRAGHQFEFRIWYDNTALLKEEAMGVAQVQ
jgi:hypothetical protein